MAKRNGPVPTPTSLRIMRGNPQRRPLNTREPKVTPAISTEPPDWLVGEARAIWERLAPRFLAMGTLADVDLDALAAACMWWGRFRDAVDAMKKAKGPMEYKRAFTHAERAHYQAKQGFQEFGVYPGSRSRIIANVQESDDPLTAHLASTPKVAASA